ncbi:MAG TPA: glycosyltransferase [Longimicrobiales bacterium]|nr:glycosyltransferase [Longimicrobiales bacterium]
MTGPTISIPSVPHGERRPLWSVMIPTYNCAGYLRATLESVLSQDPGPDVMQIEVVDDHSSRDDPRAVVEKVGGGRVSFYRQRENVGNTKNFDTCLQRARGHLVHLLHGDDCVRPGFYARLEAAFASKPDIGAAFCRYAVMDEDGNPIRLAPLEQAVAGVIPDWLARIASGQRLQTPAMVVRRSTYEHLGGFAHAITYCEDWEMWVRIGAHYAVWYEPEPLALYRVHKRSLSGRMLRTGENVQYLRRVIEMNRALLPRDRVDEITRQALRNTAAAAVRRSLRLLRSGDVTGARAQFREALTCNRSPVVLGGAASSVVIGAAAGLGRAVLSTLGRGPGAQGT